MMKYNHFYHFLSEDFSYIHEIKSLEQDKVRSLINRIFEFASQSTLDAIDKNDLNPQLFRYLALEAATNCISAYPMLKHTPASLRSLFSVPTRQDRKKGRYSTQYLREKAEKKDKAPDWKTLTNLKEKLNLIKLYKSLREYQDQLVKYIEDDIETRELPLPPVISERNDHSEFSINRLKSFFLNQIPQITNIYESDVSIDGSPTPDLIIEINNSLIWWLELKEWEDFELILKPAYQVVRYLFEAGNVIFWIEGEHKTFFDNLTGTSPVSIFIETTQQEMRRLKLREAKLREKHAGFWKIGKIIHNQLTVREKIILLTIIDEIMAEDLGLLYAEKKAGKALLRLLKENFDPSQNIHKSYFSSKKLLVPDLPTILIQKNFQWEKNKLG